MDELWIVIQDDCICKKGTYDECKRLYDRKVEDMKAFGKIYGVDIEENVYLVKAHERTVPKRTNELWSDRDFKEKDVVDPYIWEYQSKKYYE